MQRKLLLNRRQVLAATALAVAQRAEAAPVSAASPSSPPSTLIIAGPSGGRMSRWADVLAPIIGEALPRRLPLQLRNLGGLDGVTGANQFQARSEPDGSTALLLPGSAMLSWLAGEVRAKFDPARWMALWATAGSSVLVSRRPLSSAGTLRIAAANVAGPELPIFLALDQVGLQAIPSPPREADAVLLQGPGIQQALARAQAAGFQPALTLGSLGADAEPVRDPLLPSTPTLYDLVANRGSPEMRAAIRASTLAVQMGAGLMLPQLTPAPSVALWRKACRSTLDDAQVMQEAAQQGAELVAPADAASCMSRIAGDPATLLTIRGWLATRHDWRPT